MRISTCAPWVALCAMPVFVFSQTPPGCQNLVNRAIIARAMPDLAPSLVLPGSLQTSFSATPRQNGANRNVIERAIRALGSRVFPGKPQPRPAVHSWVGADFGFAPTTHAAADPCAAAPVRTYR